MFLDCADRVITSPASPIAERQKRPPPEPHQPTAMVMTLEKEALVATMHKGNCPTGLRVVDPFEDEAIWAIADDGCNSCTHSYAWRVDAEEK